jgi:hypothetical protein
VIRIWSELPVARMKEQVADVATLVWTDYSTLLEYTPDPLGDWAGRRHDRLARAELASVGLRP